MNYTHIFLISILLLFAALTGCGPNPAKPLVKGKSGLYQVKELRQLRPLEDTVLCRDCGELLIFMQDKTLGEHGSALWVISNHPAFDFLSGGSNGSYWNFEIDGDLILLNALTAGSTSFQTITYQVDDLGGNTQTWTSYGRNHSLVLESKDFE